MYRERVAASTPIGVYGKVVDVSGLAIQATGPPMRIGDLCYIRSGAGHPPAPVEVVGFRGSRILLMALGDMAGIAPSSLLIPTFRTQTVGVGLGLLGRVIGAMGAPLDGKAPVTCTDRVPLTISAPRPFDRERITQPLATGIRAIDACATFGRGQRVGILSGTGLGKSKMIGMIARNTNADINVIALVGERGREVREFVEGDLGNEGLARSIVVVATSDEPALMRIKAAYLATAVAEWYRDQGADVMLLMDSITRFAMAQREVGLAVGEPPTTKGYPPSVYALLPKLLERAGNTTAGSITGVYSVLVESDDINDPIGDAVRSILDGHVTLTRELASRNHYPAISVLDSISRCMVDIVPNSHLHLAGELRRILATYRDAEDLVNIGAYAEGSNPEIDEALRLMPAIRAFLRQGMEEKATLEEVEPMMQRILGAA